MISAHRNDWFSRNWLQVKDMAVNMIVPVEKSPIVPWLVVGSIYFIIRH